MRRILLACCLVVLSTLPVLADPGGHGKGKGKKSCDAEALAAAMEIVASACDCDTASNHGRYVSCAAHALRDALKDPEVASALKACKGLVRRGVARSTCGKPDFVACCAPQDGGAPTCSIKREEKCQAAACASPRPSCMDACTDTGCAASPSGAFVADR